MKRRSSSIQESLDTTLIPIPNAHITEITLDIFKFLNRDVIEKCQMVSHQWNSLVLGCAQVLPLRSCSFIKLMDITVYGHNKLDQSSIIYREKMNKGEISSDIKFPDFMREILDETNITVEFICDASLVPSKRPFQISLKDLEQLNSNRDPNHASYHHIRYLKNCIFYTLSHGEYHEPVSKPDSEKFEEIRQFITKLIEIVTTSKHSETFIKNYNIKVETEIEEEEPKDYELFKEKFFPQITSIVWWTTAVPLFIVLAVSAVKDAYDDIQRHISDNAINNRKTLVIRNGQLEEEKWKNIKVGDIIRLENNQFITADLLLLSSSEPYGICYIETAELDGETNLKARTALPEVAAMGDDIKRISTFDGKETKLMMNSGKTKFKRTSIDRFLNVLILGIVLFLIILCLIAAILCGVWESTTGKDFTIYLDWDRSIIPHGDASNGQIVLISFLNFFSYIILLNTLVPISLYVSVEIIRFIHSLWINYDLEMYYEKNDTPAKARTTTLNEELGQVQYVFSDKTGTLTQNIMTFNKCTINGVGYGEVMNDRGETIEISESTKPLDLSKNKWYEPEFKFYDRRLLEDTEKEISEYEAQSPDEAALTSAARNFGFVFKSRTPQSITIEVNGKDEVYELLQILDFNNVRKRMAVLIRDHSRNIKLYCKGADTVILERLRSDTSSLLKEATIQHLDKFAGEGLRTLCIAYKNVETGYCLDWLHRHKEAATSMHNKEQLLDNLYEEIEKEMILLGGTGIEDKLQDGVPGTIQRLTEANIKVWVLTGDKTVRLLTETLKDIFLIEGKDEKEVEFQLNETAKSIIAVNGEQKTVQTDLSNHRADILTMLENNFKNEQEKPLDALHNAEAATISPRSNQTLAQTPQETKGYALVINGDSLSHALSTQEKAFLEVTSACSTVICCRVTPLQKAQVVDLIKRNKKAVTLAIGDGANDVSMIKTAHIGVGIS
uniref:Phospholipid-transporting ATPase n=1 Tax=Acrobeloides nanus TaxID=290746 RepID=A0A914EH55_9BILA